jgi:uncharacterized membrane protein YraQ (UPF0718 family)
MIVSPIYWIIGGVFMAGSWYKSREITGKSFKKARKVIGGMMPDLVGLLLLIGLFQAYVPFERLAIVMNEQSAIISTFVAAAVGSITIIPAFAAFPMVGGLIDSGVGIVPATAFLTTLTMVGVATFPIEKKTFGTRFTLWRNGLSFIAAIVVALLMGVIL